MYIAIVLQMKYKRLCSNVQSILSLSGRHLGRLSLAQFNMASCLMIRPNVMSHCDVFAWHTRRLPISSPPLYTNFETRTFHFTDLAGFLIDACLLTLDFLCTYRSLTHVLQAWLPRQLVHEGKRRAAVHWLTEYSDLYWHLQVEERIERPL